MTKPILFSTTMVQAILDGRKTQTRRVVKIKNGKWKLSYEANNPNRTDLDAFGVLDENRNLVEIEDGMPGTLKELNLCKWAVGDILWVRETWRPVEQDFGKPRYEYKATEKINLTDKWKPSIFMPKDACRIFLEVTNVRAERLHSITYGDCILEGIKDGIGHNADLAYKKLWSNINGAASWEANPYIWVIEFKQVDKPLTP